MLILQLKKRIEILEAQMKEQDNKINDILIRLSVPTAPTLIHREIPRTLRSERLEGRAQSNERLEGCRA